MLVDALKQTYALSDLLSELDLARSSYFHHRARLRASDRYAAARSTITEIFDLNYRCCGYRRIQAAMGRQEVFISEKVMRRLMRQESLSVTTKRRRYGSYQGEISPAPENLINRDFRATAPNKKWLTDITEFQIPAGKVYLSPVIDCFDGLVVHAGLSGLAVKASMILHFCHAHAIGTTMCDLALLTHSRGGTRSFQFAPLPWTSRPVHFGLNLPPFCGSRPSHQNSTIYRH